MAGLVKRGQVWVADLNPGFGAEIHKKRPATKKPKAIVSRNAFVSRLWGSS